MSGTTQSPIEQVEIKLRGKDGVLPIYFDVFDSQLSQKWLLALNNLIKNSYHLEKNYCFLGFPNGQRDGKLIIDQINKSIFAINNSNIGYNINDHFTLENSVESGELISEELYSLDDQRAPKLPGDIKHESFNKLHRYFEDLQGVSGKMSEYYGRADAYTKWHIRQLNLLCHEFESWALSHKKKYTSPEWIRPSQLMCWLKAPRFDLTEDDYELFGIDTINRSLGGVFVGVNKAIGKHHWEVFVDEAAYDPNVVIDNLTTTTMRGQLEASGDFDIEWGNNPGNYVWQKKHLLDFRQWLINNNFDPNDKRLTIGHPQIGQIDLLRSFQTQDHKKIINVLEQHLDVYSITTSQAHAEYDYHWSDDDFINTQVSILEK